MEFDFCVVVFFAAYALISAYFEAKGKSKENLLMMRISLFQYFNPLKVSCLS
jgi:uncharacterized membrane protein